MASIAKERPKFEPKSPATKPHHHALLMEPSPNCFPSKRDLLRLLAVVAIAASVAIACNHAVTLLNRLAKPFCDSNVELDESLVDVCEPCPSNGVCHEGKLDCLRGYRKLGRSCVEDGDIDETAKKIAKLIEIRLCEAYAQYLCEGVGTAWVREEELWNSLDEFKLVERFGLDDAKFMHAKERAMETIGKLLETRPTNIGIKDLKCPELLVERYKPITCRIRQWIAKHALVLVPICALLLGCTLILFRVRQRHYLSARAEHLYNKVCDILEENALISRSEKGEGEPWVVASWLRDDLLLPRERRDPSLWKKVEELVQEDSRLDWYPKMVKGELKVVWEWQVEGSLSALAKRKKGEESKQKLNESTSTSSIHQRLASKDGSFKMLTFV